MQTPRHSRLIPFCFAAGLVPVLLALTLPALSSYHDAGPPETPSQVADTLDGIVQPRFQQNAGRFGVDRVIHLEGHERVTWVDPTNRREARQLARVKASHRSYVLAFLHCRHKPGVHIDPPEPVEMVNRGFTPSVGALLAVGGTQDGAVRDFQWADKALGPVVLPYLAGLRQGRPAQTDYENWVVVMRPVRALRQSCINCHAGTKRGDTLGVMVYAVDKNAKIKGQSFDADTGDGDSEQ